MIAAVLLPAGFAALGALRALLAVAQGPETVGGDAELHQELLGGEGTAVADAFKNPLKLAKVSMSGVKTEGAMAADIPLDNARPADYVFSAHVQNKLEEIRRTQPKAKKTAKVS